MHQPTTGSSFFRFPSEIRNVIYELVLRQSFQIPVLPPDQETDDVLDRLTRRIGPRNTHSRVATYNALSLTCRQAYSESIQFYYEKNHFETYTGQAFQDYVDAIPQRHLNLVQVLSIRIQRLTSGLEISRRIGGLYMSPGSCRWTLSNPHLLDNFQTLKVLQLQGRFRLSWHGVLVPNARIFEQLVALSSRLPQLIQICVQTLAPCSHIHTFDYFDLEIEDTPGWDYCNETFCQCSGKQLPKGSDFNVIEYLTREDALEKGIGSL